MRKIEQREPWKCLLLTIVTCGVYGLYWMYKVMESLSIIKKDYNNEFWKWLVLSFITCSIYNIYWTYKNAKFLYEVQLKQKTNYIPNDRSMMFMVFFAVTLCLGFPLTILIPFYFQKDLNAFAFCEERAAMEESSSPMMDGEGVNEGEDVITVTRDTSSSTPVEKADIDSNVDDVKESEDVITTITRSEDSKLNETETTLKDENKDLY